MNIKRDGVEIKLTTDEMIMIWAEVERQNIIRDLELVFKDVFAWDDSYTDKLQYALREVGVDV